MKMSKRVFTSWRTLLPTCRSLALAPKRDALLPSAGRTLLRSSTLQAGFTGQGLPTGSAHRIAFFALVLAEASRRSFPASLCLSAFFCLRLLVLVTQWADLGLLLDGGGSLPCFFDAYGTIIFRVPLPTLYFRLPKQVLSTCMFLTWQACAEAHVPCKYGFEPILRDAVHSRTQTSLSGT